MYAVLVLRENEKQCTGIPPKCLCATVYAVFMLQQKEKQCDSTAQGTCTGYATVYAVLILQENEKQCTSQVFVRYRVR